MSTISENIFDQNHVGVLSFFDQAQQIHHNQINFDQTGMPEWSGFGVWVSNASGGLQGNQFQYSTAIEDNVMNGGRIGVEVRNTSFAIVEGNAIQVAYHDQWPGFFNESWGIHLDQCTKAIVSDNTVTGAVTDTWAWWDTGIRTDNCALTRMVCNTTENLHIGILNGGMALSTYMFNNTMQGYHHRGLIQNWGLLGQQGSATAPTDHQWVGTFQESHTQRIYDGNDPNPPASLPFYVRANSGGTDYNPTGFTAVSSPVDLFQYRINLTPANTGAVAPYGCPVDWRNAAALADVVNDSIKWHGPDSLEQRALARLEVFRAINADSTLQADATLLAFRDSFATTDLGMFENYNAKLDVQMPDSVAHAVARKLTTIHGTTMVAKHWGTVLQLAFSKWADEDSTTNFDSSDSTLLKEIALLCPYTSGPAVSLARTLLFSPTKEYFSLYNECEIPAFTPPSSRFGQEPISDKGPQISITPNPTTGIIQVNATGYDITTLQWQVTDLTGKSLLAGRLRNLSIDLSTLDPGTYLVRISNQGTTEFSTKVVLIRP